MHRMPHLEVRRVAQNSKCVINAKTRASVERAGVECQALGELGAIEDTEVGRVWRPDKSPVRPLLLSCRITL